MRHRPLLVATHPDDCATDSRYARTLAPSTLAIRRSPLVRSLGCPQSFRPEPNLALVHRRIAPPPPWLFRTPQAELQLPSSPYHTQSTAGHSTTHIPTTFEITHPFHPQRGCKFVLAARKQTWGEDRVMYFDAQRRLRSMLACWTSATEQDAFSQVSAGRSWFRVDDLLKLVAWLEQRGSAAALSVKQIAPQTSNNIRRNKRRKGHSK